MRVWDDTIGNESNTDRKHTVNGKEVRIREDRIKSRGTKSCTLKAISKCICSVSCQSRIERSHHPLYLLLLSRNMMKALSDSLWTALCSSDPFTERDSLFKSIKHCLPREAERIVRVTSSSSRGITMGMTTETSDGDSFREKSYRRILIDRLRRKNEEKSRMKEESQRSWWSSSSSLWLVTKVLHLQVCHLLLLKGFRNFNPSTRMTRVDDEDLHRIIILHTLFLHSSHSSSFSRQRILNWKLFN